MSKEHQNEYDVPDFGFHKVLGYQVKLSEKGDSHLTMEINEMHLNRNLVAHGGVIVGLLDVTAWWATRGLVSHKKKFQSATISLNTHFLKAITAGPVDAYGHCTRSGRDLYFVEAHLLDQDKNLCANGSFIFRTINRPID